MSKLTEQEIVRVNGVLRVCCSFPENLITQPQGSDLVVRVCRVCDRKHYEFGADAGYYNLRNA